MGIFKIWKEHFANKKTIYLNYLPLWNFFIFLLLPKNTVLGPITGGSNFTKSNSLNYYVRKYIFPILFFISLKIIKKKFNLIIFSTDLLRKYIKNDQKFIFNYCLNIYKNKFFKNKKVYDIIFYYRKNRNKNTPSCLKRKKLTTTTSIYYMPARRDDYAKAIEDHGFGLQSSRRWQLAICCIIAPVKETKHFKIS